MDSISLSLMTFGDAIGATVSDNPILLVLGIGLATAIWRFSGKPKQPE